MHVHEHIWTNHRSRRARLIQKSSSRDMLSSSVLLAMNPNFPIYIFSTSFYNFYLNATSINSLRILHSLFCSSSSHSISLPPPYRTPNVMPPPPFWNLWMESNFVMPEYSWAWDHLLEHDWPHRSQNLKTTTTTTTLWLCLSQQLSRTPQPEVALCTHPSPLHAGFVSVDLV